MRALDTNVLVRLVTRDDARQVVAAEDFVAPGAWVSCLVLESGLGAQRTWTIFPTRPRSPLPCRCSSIHKDMTIQDADAVAAALATAEAPGGDFRMHRVEVARKPAIAYRPRRERGKMEGPEI